jgi:DNA-directed RNA polymerase subunit RPC12/RpoP
VLTICPDCGQKLAAACPTKFSWGSETPHKVTERVCPTCSSLWNIVVTLQPSTDPAVKVYFIDFLPLDPTTVIQ